MNEKFILTKTMHLGFVKDTFQKGAVIEHDEDRGVLIINGRKFQDTRDLDILQRHNWIVPYDKEVLEEFLASTQPEPVVKKKPRPGENMEVVQSDEDLMADPIDIRETQVSKRNNEAKETSREAARNREKDRKMEVIKGDESVEERLATLKDKTDINSMSERVRLKQQRAKMDVVHDDSLGMGVGKSEIPMNAGQSLPSREEAESKKIAAQADAEARKKQIEKTREQAGVEVPDGVGEVEEPAAQEVSDTTEGPIVSEVDQDIPEEVSSDSEASGDANGDMETPVETEQDIDAQIAALQAKKAALTDESPKEAEEVERTPVTD